MIVQVNKDNHIFQKVLTINIKIIIIKISNLIIGKTIIIIQRIIIVMNQKILHTGEDKVSLLILLMKEIEIIQILEDVEEIQIITINLQIILPKIIKVEKIVHQEIKNQIINNQVEIKISRK